MSMFDAYERQVSVMSWWSLRVRGDESYGASMQHMVWWLKVLHGDADDWESLL